MKFITLFTCLLMALVGYTSAQRCVPPPNPSCSGLSNVGRSGPRCVPRTMWYFDIIARQCRQMRYLGCGGNSNRWCTRTACERTCRRE